jgi:hypothetical protein
MGLLVKKSTYVLSIFTGQVFSEYFGFPLPFIPPISPSSQLTWAGTIGQ